MNRDMIRRSLPVLSAVLLGACSIFGQRQSASNDTMPPYINMRQYEFYTEVGQPLDFSNIGGYDDVDGMLPTRVRGYVDYDREGEYYPSIVCTDLSGNESEQVITVHVVKSGTLPHETISETPVPTPSYCENGTDPNQPCNVLLNRVASQYKTLYEGEEGREQCEAANGEEACELLERNDGSFWGYGVR